MSWRIRKKGRAEKCWGRGSKGKSWSNLSNKMNRISDWSLKCVLNTHGSILIKTSDWPIRGAGRTEALEQIPRGVIQGLSPQGPGDWLPHHPCGQHVTSFQRTQHGNKEESRWLYSWKPDRRHSQVTNASPNRDFMLGMSPLMWGENRASDLYLIIRETASISQQRTFHRHSGCSLSKPSRSSNSRKPENLCQPRGAWGAVMTECPMGSWRGPWDRRKVFR